jgi:hypothetical protein
MGHMYSSARLRDTFHKYLMDGFQWKYKDADLSMFTEFKFVSK